MLLPKMKIMIIIKMKIKWHMKVKICKNFNI